jgi:hypothetical protein
VRILFIALQAGYRTRIKAILSVLENNFGYKHATDAPVLTEVDPFVFDPSHDADFKEKTAIDRMKLARTEPERFVQLCTKVSLEECGIWVDSALYVILGVSPAETGGPGIVGGDAEHKEHDVATRPPLPRFMDKSHLDRRRTASTAPPYRRFDAGLNVESTCVTKTCPAYARQITIHVGHTPESGIDLFKEVFLKRSFRCPLCSKPVSAITTFGFSGCSFSWRGVTDKGIRREDRSTVPPSRYQVYESPSFLNDKPTSRAASMIETWEILQTTTSPLKEETTTIH